ncbi:MAG: response regulator [Hyphomonadaceae bacterium]
MDMRDWTVALIEPNKFEAQIVLDLLRAAGVQKVRRFADSKEALAALELYAANIILMEMESAPLDGAEWTRLFRRDRRVANRKAPIFMLSRAVSRAMAETCRHAGVNAIIGKPISGAVLIATIKKVLGAPRAFIDADGYVGPCRRAGIVTAGLPGKRRRSDAAAGPGADALTAAIAALARAADALLNGRTGKNEADAALSAVQAIAKEKGDGPLMRGCAAYALLVAGADMAQAALEPALAAANDSIAKLAALPLEQSAERDALAEKMRAIAAKAATQKAA